MKSLQSYNNTHPLIHGCMSKLSFNTQENTQENKYQTKIIKPLDMVKSKKLDSGTILFKWIGC